MDRGTPEDNFELKNLDISQQLAPKDLDNGEPEPANQTAHVEIAEGGDDNPEGHQSETRQHHVREQREYDEYNEDYDDDANEYDEDSPPPYSDDFLPKTEVSYLQKASTAYNKNVSTAYHKVALTNYNKNASAAYHKNALTVYLKNDSTFYPKITSTTYPTTAYPKNASTVYPKNASTAYHKNASTAYHKNASTAYPKNASTVYPKNASTDYPKNASTAYCKNASTAYPKNTSTAYPKSTNPLHYNIYISRMSQKFPRNDNSGRQLLQPTSHLPVHGDSSSRPNVQSDRDEATSQIGSQHVPNYARLSVFILCFCCLPLGVGGLVYSVKANTLKEVHKYADARRAANKALSLNLSGLVLGIILIVCSVYYAIKEMKDFNGP